MTTNSKAYWLTTCSLTYFIYLMSALLGEFTEILNPNTSFPNDLGKSHNIFEILFPHPQNKGNAICSGFFTGFV